MLLGRVSVAAQESKPFALVLWQDGGPAESAELWAEIAARGFDGVGLRPGADMDGARAAGLEIVVDQLLGKGILELRDEQWGGPPDGTLRARPVCLSDPKTWELLEAALAEGVAQLGEGPIRAISLADEASDTRHTDPYDVCDSEHARKRMRLSGRASFWTLDTFLQWAGPDIVGTAETRRAVLGGETLPGMLFGWVDSRAFRDLIWAEVCAKISAAARAAVPGVPVGWTGMQPPSAFGGHDYRRLLAAGDLREVYAEGGAADLALAMRPDVHRLATLFPPQPGEPPRATEYRLSRMVARGITTVAVWSTGRVLGADLELQRFGAQVIAAHDVLAPAAARLAGAVPETSPIWLLESQDSVHLHWMLDSARDGDTWPRRLSSYEVTHSTSMAARASWFALLADLGHAVTAVAEPELERRLAAEEAPRLLVLPAQLSIAQRSFLRGGIHWPRRNTPDALSRYVSDGGHLLADHGAGLYDFGGLRALGALDPLFGITARSLRWRDQLVSQGRAAGTGRLADGTAAAERGLQGDPGHREEGFALDFETVHGDGLATYWNRAVCEYAAAREDPRRTRLVASFRRLLGAALERAGIRPPVRVTGEDQPPWVQARVWRGRKGERFVTVQVVVEDLQLLRGLPERIPLTLEFRESVQLVPLLEGEERAAARSHPVQLDPWRGAFFELR